MILIKANALHIPLKDESVQCCVTSPPYWGLRDYGVEPMVWDDPGDCEHEWQPTKISGGNGDGKSFHRNKEDAALKRGGRQPGTCLHCGAWDGSLGLEDTPELYVSHIVQIFREVRRVLKEDGTLWLNLGDSYASGKGSCFNPGGGENSLEGHAKLKDAGAYKLNRPNISDLEIMGLKPKDLCMIPFRVALALQADGWYLRSAIPWIKRNSMPESCKDRPTTAVEYVFLLSKSERYFYDHEAVKLPASLDTHARYARGRSDKHKWADGGPGGQTIASTFEHMKKPAGWQAGSGTHDQRNFKGRYPGVTPKSQPAGSGVKANDSFQAACKDVVGTRARRNSDWFFESFQGLLSNEDGDPLALVVNSQGFKGAHFATFPERLVEPCIKAGSRQGDIIFDPFGGSGTVARVSVKYNRRAVHCDLTYHDLAKSLRCANIQRKIFA